VVAECPSGRPADPNFQVFVRGLASGRLVLASRGPRGVANNNDAFAPSISADGRYVAFTSDATNLGVKKRRISDQVFVRDLRTNTTTLVSRRTDRHGRRFRSGEHASISADGRVVAFDTGVNFSDAYVRDVRTDTTTLVSRASGTSSTGSRFTMATRPPAARETLPGTAPHAWVGQSFRLERSKQLRGDCGPYVGRAAPELSPDARRV
jgi:hypothetical protein